MSGHMQMYGQAATQPQRRCTDLMDAGFFCSSHDARGGDVRDAGWGVCVAWVVLGENESDLLCAPPPAGGGAASPSALRS